MKRLTNDQMAQMLEVGYELRNLEHKPPFGWNDNNSTWVKEKLTRAVLAMTNIRYGGQIIIGIDETKTKEIRLTGLTDVQLKTFEDFDGIKGFIDGFSYTNTDFDIEWGEHNGSKFVVITVQEFSEIPAICRKDGQTTGTLRKDDIYARSKRAPYSSIRVTETELREMIKMAIDKEKTDLKSRGYVKKSIVSPEEFYKKQIKDLT